SMWQWWRRDFFLALSLLGRGWRGFASRVRGNVSPLAELYPLPGRRRSGHPLPSGERGSEDSMYYIDANSFMNAVVLSILGVTAVLLGATLVAARAGK